VALVNLFHVAEVELHGPGPVAAIGEGIRNDQIPAALFTIDLKKPGELRW
jgi:hypothetical protein